MLLMKKVFFDGIRAGTKTTTLRYWRRRRVRPGSVQTVPGLGRVRIESAEVAEPGELSDDDARADGFADLAALRSALDELYPPEARAGRRLYRVRFTLLNESPHS
jgi:hypothetical protein